MNSPAVVLHCQACDAEVAYVYGGTDDDVVLAGRVRDTAAATERAVTLGVDRRRHRRRSWAATETQLRGDGYARSDPEAWCAEHGRMRVPHRDRLLAYFDRAAGRVVRVRVPPVG